MSRQYTGLALLTILVFGLVGLPPEVAHAQDGFDTDSTPWVEEPEDIDVDDAEAPYEIYVEATPDFEVAFDHLRVAREGGGIVVAYQVDPRDWKAAQRENITLWMSIFIPTSTEPPAFSYSYHMPIDEPRGVVEYPDWLTTFSADEMGLCALGTRPYDNLGLGQGYACTDIQLADVHGTVQHSGAPRTFQLIYYPAIPYYGYFPWRGPFW